MITNTISWIEAIWTVLAITGTGITAVNFYDALVDLRLIRQVLPRNGRHAIAKSQVRTESVRLLTMIGFAVVGVVAMSAVNRSGNLSVAAAVLVVIELAMIVNSVLDAHLRRYLTREMPKHPEGLH